MVFFLAASLKTHLIIILMMVMIDHRASMTPATPQLETCDEAVMNWSPPGCDLLGLCQPVPQSRPYKCFWPH